MTNIEKAKELIEKAKIGQLVPIYKTISTSLNASEYFAKLSDYGRNKNSIFFESGETIERYGEISLGTTNPCLRISGKGDYFEIKSLNNLGKDIIDYIKKDFGFCKKVEKKKDCISGFIEPFKGNVSEDQRLKQKTHMEILRKIIFQFKPVEKLSIPSCGLFGAFSFDLINHFEDITNIQQDLLQAPDYLFYLADHLFVIDHKKNETHLIACALLTHNKKDAVYKRCLKIIQDYEQIFKNKPATSKKSKPRNFTVENGVSQQEFENQIARVKQNLTLGNIYKTFITNTMISDYNSEPFDIYKKLKERNPKPYMFFINDKEGILIGGSNNPVKIYGDQEKKVEIKISSGDKPRGVINNQIDTDLDNKYGIELKTDKQLLIDHTMMVDMARNDVARISKYNSREVSNPFIIEKFSNKQQLSTIIKGTLREDLDSLNAYNSLMNNGMINGLPKIRSLKMIMELEKNKRGFFGGLVCYITPDNDLNGGIITELLLLKNNKAFIMEGTGVIFGSDQKECIKVIEEKIKSNLILIKSCGGFK